MKASIAKKALMATHGGLSLQLCAVIENICPMAIYRWVCWVGQTCLVRLMTRCHLPLPQYFIADEKHSHCLSKRVYLPTIGCGRVQKASGLHDRQVGFRGIFFVNNARKTPNNRSLGQRLRRFVEEVQSLAGEDNGERVRKWIQRKKAGWHVLFADASIPFSTTWVDQFHNAMDRKLFMMKGFHHEGGSQRVFLNGLAILANLIPYQRRAINGGKCAVEVEGGKVPTKDWFLNLQILTSGGFQ
ncbi:hypothetical protein IH992_33885 [Candidatus Poribacteria bacterium]|nr:hypothetical protein [Candidatus Poribacteria bacterium]